MIVGPTAVGKTDLSIQLAKQFNGEIISGDSMQVYRGMDIGTAKATPEEQRQVPHHLIDIKDPEESFSVAEFQKLALEAIADIQSRGHLPILVGGTGLYVKSVLYYPQYHFQPNEEGLHIRKKWQAFLEIHGEQKLWEEVYKVAPDIANRLHPNDTRRLIRALELYEQNQLPIHQEKHQSPFDFLMIGLTMPRDQLYERINRRVDLMIEAGLIDEVKNLLKTTTNESLTSMQSLGYKELVPYIRGEISLEEAVELIKKRTRQFAKRQLTWFRQMEDIHWFDVSPENKANNLLQIFKIVAGKFGNLENYSTNTY